MGQSPVEDVVSDWFAKQHPTIKPIAFYRDGRPMWPMIGGDGTGDGNDGSDDSDDGDEDDSDDGDEDEDGDDEEADKAKTKSKTISAARAKELHDENSRRRNENKTLRDEQAKLAAKLKKFEDADKSEIDKVTGERDELKTASEKQASTIRQQALKIAFLQDNTQAWHNPKAALRLLELDGVEIDDDGEVKGMSEAITKLAKDNPYLVKGKTDDEDDEESGAPRKSGSPVSKKATAQKQALEKKYRLG